MEARAYVEAVAAELGRLRGRGLLLSPTDARLALGWHAAGLPLAEVIRAVRAGTGLLPKSGARAPRGASSPQVSLAAIAPSLERRLKDRAARTAREVSGRTSLADELRRAAAAPGLPERARWQALAGEAEALLGRSPDAFWSAVIEALLASLRKLPRADRLRAGAELRARLRPRQRRVSPARFRRSLQLQLARSCSELFHVPPPAFLL